MAAYTENNLKGIRERIQDIIKTSELTVSAFAIRTKNKQKNIANIVNGNNFPSWEVIFNICTNAPSLRGLENLDIRWLITGIKTPQDNIVSEGKQKYISRSEDLITLKNEIAQLTKQLESKEEVIRLQNELLDNYRKQLNMI